MRVGILKETFPNERRVELVPSEVPRLSKRSLEVIVQRTAGVEAGYLDAQYEAKGARLVDDRETLLQQADIIIFVRGLGADAAQEPALAWGGMRPGQALVGLCDPLGSPRHVAALTGSGLHVLAMELMPRISRAQSMDALSSMANIAGYKSVLVAASHAPKLFPMMMTAAGTIAPAKVLVLGVGVAGLQAIATARRLGAVVEAYDVRPEVKEQVRSVGGKFVELDLPKTEVAAGYATEQSAAFYRQQREQLAVYVRAADIIITTAAVPGRRAPVLVTAEMLKGAKAGAVLVDLAAETGGNCALTRAGETVQVDGVSVMGPVNLASTVPFHASQLYARNIAAFLELLCRPDGTLQLDTTDEIIRETLVLHDGNLVHDRVQQAAKA